MANEPKRVSGRQRKTVSSGVAKVGASYGNTMITIVDAQGNTISWTAADSLGFKGSRKSMPYAAQVATEKAARNAVKHGMRALEIEVSGPGSGRESALRALQAAGFTVTSIRGVADGNFLSGLGGKRKRRHIGSTVGNPERVVAARTYEPDARAQAVLQGIAYAEKDLEAAGGTYDTDEVRALFRGISRQAVDKKVADGSLLAVPGPRGRRRFPAAQFADDGSVVDGLKEVQSALGFSSQWSVLNFLLNGHDLLGNEKPIDALRRGDVGRVVEAAKRSGVHGA